MVGEYAIMKVHRVALVAMVDATEVDKWRKEVGAVKSVSVEALQAALDQSGAA